MCGSGVNFDSRSRQYIASYVGQLPPENVYITQRCRLIWKRHIPLKIRIFRWLLLRRRLMTRVARQRMFPDSPVSCPLCWGGGGGGGPEDCSHLFFQCSLAQEAWRGAAVARLSVTSEEAFWSSLSGGSFRREADLCHTVGDMDPQERGHLQGHLPVRRCHYAYS